ncbi:MAG: hypothetical protein Q9166_007257 [cf. Caloplaca sp. 2 TL-2023]
MDDDITTWRALHDACKYGDTPSVRTFLEMTLPTLGLSSRRTFCSHPSSPCSSLPCPLALNQLLLAASEGNHPPLFAYLWDTHFAPHGMVSIPWECLRVAAYQGSIGLAETFFERDRECFNATEPPPTIGPVARDGHQQFNIAIRNDRFEYVDFMLAHGGSINAGFDNGNDLLRMVVRCAVEDEVTIRRVQFLASRGVRVRESGALMEVIKGESVELADCLLGCGADVNSVEGSGGPSPLIIAANEDFEDMVQMLVDRGADSGAVDKQGKDALAIAKEKGHGAVERILQSK